jgi:gentisate 1,2-dioxygenase
MDITPQDLARSASLDELYGKLEAFGAGPGWNKPIPAMWNTPRENFRPAHWSFAHAKGALEAAGRLISTELAERRNLILFNPVEGNTYATLRTLIVAYQMIMPGERARAHRHTANALRLVLDAEPGTFTVVDGEKIPMLPGDVLLTPNWSSHAHGNDGRASAIWLDFLDVPLVQLLEPMFFDPHLDDDHQHEAFDQNPAPPRTTPLVFPLSETLARLKDATPDPTGRFGQMIELGAPALDTISLHMIGLDARQATAPLQTTANNIYSVVEGSGTTIVDGERFAWRRGDVVAVPAWRPHHHEAAEASILFRVSDEPVLARLGFLRTARPQAH